MKTAITAKDLIKIGYKTGPWIPLVLEAISKGSLKYAPDKERLEVAGDILAHPEEYRENEYWGKVVEKIYPPKQVNALRDTCVPIEMFGVPLIEEGALHQIYQSAKLPVSYRAALMPDAHSGYGLPIGGVLATTNAVIPYGVGVDIGCRMAMTLYPIRDLSNPSIHKELCDAIVKNTTFGAGGERPKQAEHEVMDNEMFSTISILRNLKDKAAKQLGTSGSGNHFVEWGEVQFTDDTIVPRGTYLALLSHSGSRGLGANIAKRYTDVAKKKRKLDTTISNLAWLMMDEEEGIEYWNAMNLAGDYAKACHDIIHASIAKEIWEKPILKIENHHNFAWKETHYGEDVIVHRKGATPAGKGVMGIIPGSMATPGYVVIGKGNSASLESASHGGGRAMSRSKAKQSFIWHSVREQLEKANVHLIGGGLDECPESYKDIDKVMSYQTELVDVVAKFSPRIVRMTGDNSEPED